MKTITLQIDETIQEKFEWLLHHFSQDELKIIEQSEYQSDDHYLRTIPGMVESIKSARKEPLESGVELSQLDW
ncbi:hypothetical protein D5085_07825 [Ectothiorhodospiraceae bacterium BW-2]|nr:hypothetical protein D5085_07825 [Ectothiorhodospiraceae bacterium BW-2]